MPKPPLSTYAAAHFRWRVADRVGFVELDRPDRKNPLTFDSYAELRDLFRALPYEREVRAIVFSGAGGNFCSGGDVHEIIGPLTNMAMPELLDFTRMTGDLVRAIRACPRWSSQRSMGRVPAPGRSSRWPPISAWEPQRRARHFCSRASDWPAATWAHAPYCRGSSARAAPPNY